jgi:hypothetical protein
MAAKPQFSIKDTSNGHIHCLLDTQKDPAWFDVRTVEEHRNSDGTLFSVVNHRDKSYGQRRDELRIEFGGEGVDVVPA